jgi:hypothetical protein
MLKTLLAALLLSVSTGLLAQTPSDAPKPRGERRFDCSKAKDPKACEERLAKIRARREKAREACQQDPVKCEARKKEFAAARAKIREACKDKQGEELKSCIREQRQKSQKK